MKGIILAGGTGTRLKPLTYITNKHLLPVWDRPMIDWALLHLAEIGLTDTDIGIVISKPHDNNISAYLGGDTYCYLHQGEAEGIGKAVYSAKDFIGNSLPVPLTPGFYWIRVRTHAGTAIASQGKTRHAELYVPWRLMRMRRARRSARADASRGYSPDVTLHVPQRPDTADDGARYRAPTAG